MNREGDSEQPPVKEARLAGALYLVTGVPAVFSLIYVPGKLIVAGNATATAENIQASQTLFRLGIVAEMVSAVGFLLLVMALYRLLSRVSRNQAGLMVSFVLVSVAITFANSLSYLAGLTLVRGAEFLSALGPLQRDTLAFLFVRLHRQGEVVNGIFWGLWLFPFGILVMRSGFLPRILGILLIVNGLAYVAISLTRLLLPDYGNLVNRAAFPALLGELWIMLWLLIKGARAPRPALP